MWLLVQIHGGRNYSVLVSPSDEGFVQRALVDRLATIGAIDRSTRSAVNRGRWDYANSIVVSLEHGSFQSVGSLLVLEWYKSGCSQGANGFL